eukprot:TRINITY_DN43393_c0_g1_i1.p2 TRINITY_DN43393_c0_g1~~TRINITY_DN43393_c0_g1_i1.p2  ORF type:complete len:102 (-),score=5.41 TRINITY_DN43393_c0_g1_i1:38-343(-)
MCIRDRCSRRTLLPWSRGTGLSGGSRSTTTGLVSMPMVVCDGVAMWYHVTFLGGASSRHTRGAGGGACVRYEGCLLYTSDAADEEESGDLGGGRIGKKQVK